MNKNFWTNCLEVEPREVEENIDIWVGISQAHFWAYSTYSTEAADGTEKACYNYNISVSLLILTNSDIYYY